MGEITKGDFESALASHMTPDDHVTTSSELFDQIRTRMSIEEPNISYKHFRMACLDSQILTREHVEIAFRFLISDKKSTQLSCQDLKQSLLRSCAIFPSTRKQDKISNFKELQQELEQQIHKAAAQDLNIRRPPPHTHTNG